MNNQEAKFILGGYRPGGRDAGDKMFCSALEQAKADPMLAAWLARSQAHDVAVAGKLAQIAPPAELRAAILAGARVSKKKPSRAAAVWRHPVWLSLAAAAVVVLSFSLAVWPNRTEAQVNRLADFALADTAHEIHGGHGPEQGALQTLLGQRTTRLAQGVPVDFATLKATGCRTVQFQGKDVLEVCFMRDGLVFHLYVLRSSDFPKLPVGAPPAITHRDGLCCASWGDAKEQVSYVVVSEAGAQAIRNLL